MLNRSALIAAICLAAGAAAAAEVEAPRTVTVAAGARYQAGWLRRLLLGDHWREVWDTPVEVPVLERALRSRPDLLTHPARPDYPFLADDGHVPGSEPA